MRLDAPSSLHAVGQLAGDPGPGGITFGTSFVEWTFSQPDVFGFIAVRNNGNPPLVRCDGFFGVFGCVFPGPIPFYVIDGADPRLTEYAWHVKQALLSTLHGLFSPLTRTTNEATIKANGDTACPRNRIPPPGPQTCDEYPFRSTLQGAAALPNNGRTFPGCLLEHRLPIGRPFQGAGWSACRINPNHNSAGGNSLGLFYRTQRVLDGDQFWVGVINV